MSDWRKTWPGCWNLYEGTGGKRTNVASIEIHGGVHFWLARKDPKAKWQTDSTLEGAMRKAEEAIAAVPLCPHCRQVLP